MRFTILALAALSALLASDPAGAQVPIDSCGTVEAGVTCPLLFRADSPAGLYIVDAPLGAFSVGDRIRVIGDLDTSCFSVCQQGDGCIFQSVVLNCITGIGTSYCQAVPNSTGLVGGLSAFGSESVAAGDVTIVASALPPSSLALFLCSETQGFVGQPNGSVGNLCLGGSIGRFVPQLQMVDQGGSALISTDPVFGAQSFSLGALPQPNGTAAVLPGATWNFQVWHRDSAGGQAVSNFSLGLSITFS